MIKDNYSSNKAIIERLLILLSFAGLFAIFFSESNYLGYIYISVLVLIYALYFYASNSKLEISFVMIPIILLLVLILFSIFYNHEFEYKKYKYCTLVISLILLQFNGIIFSKHLEFSIKTMLAIIIIFNLFFAGKLLINGHDNIYYIIEKNFDNIGLYAIFLSLSGIIFIYYYKQLNLKYAKYLSIGLIIIVTFVIITLKSRTALIVLITYCILEYLRKTNYSKVKCWGSLGILLLLIITLTFGIKNDSSQGRLFVWKTSALIIKDNLLTGIGYDNFASIYPLYQASMYESNKMTSKEIYLVDNTKVAFNEYIHITTELGIVGLILFISTITIILYYNKELIHISLSICIAMFFSYILHSPIITYLIILVFSLTFATPTFKINRIFTIIILFIVILFVGYNTTVNFNKQKCDKIIAILWRQSPDKVNDFYNINQEYFLDNAQLLFALAELNYNNNEVDKALILLHKLDKLITRNDIELLKGKVYSKKGILDLTEKHISRSIAICPNRFLNRYELFKFYIEHEMTEKAIQEAKKIYLLNEKIKSPHTIVIKEHIAIFLRENNISLE